VSPAPGEQPEDLLCRCRVHDLCENEAGHGDEERPEDLVCLFVFAGPDPLHLTQEPAHHPAEDVVYPPYPVLYPGP